MRALRRVFGSVVGAVGTFYFVFWVGGALLLPFKTFPWLPLIIAGLVAIAVAYYIWTRTKSAEPVGLAACVLLGALLTGSIAFAVGFFGPVLLSPRANQGPLLGIFITGPLGFVLGALGGAVYWRMRRQRTVDGGNGGAV